ncbi:hypothetical protein [Priestia megaterium]|uniref:Uncharacterized protein n=1 Tax=Priestia megaterium TaxID=1404 RepID=A0A6M6E036_PRIMG|nr:hypothetical protein [Priestia megaterium]MED4285051.1 hypothetical protein [Priestia megaterium]QJX80210.1 hypothetical protein FDZ14_29375 [Priestia megaterium]
MEKMDNISGNLRGMIGSLKNNIVIDKIVGFGKHFVFRFDNSYGLSVLEKGEGQGPQYIATVTKFDVADEDYELDYTTPVANNDVQTDNTDTIKHLLYLVKKLKSN